MNSKSFTAKNNWMKQRDAKVIKRDQVKKRDCPSFLFLIFSATSYAFLYYIMTFTYRSVKQMVTIRNVSHLIIGKMKHINRQTMKDMI